MHEERSQTSRLVTFAKPLMRRWALGSARGRASVGRAGPSDPVPAPENGLAMETEATHQVQALVDNEPVPPHPTAECSHLLEPAEGRHGQEEDENGTS